MVRRYKEKHYKNKIPKKTDTNMKIGDKVRFLSSLGGGTVAGFQGKDIVLVEDEDGFQIPTHINDVVLYRATTTAARQPLRPRCGSRKKNSRP